MDTKQLITAICIAMLAVIGWQFFVQYLAERNHWTLSNQQATHSTTTTPTAPPPPTSAPANVPMATSIATQPATGPAFVVASSATTAPSTRPAIVSIGSGVRNDPTYAIGIDLTPRGASVSEVALNEFKQSVDTPASYTYEEPIQADGILYNTLATDSIVLNGKTIDLSNVDWKLVHHTPASAVFSVTINDSAGKAIAKIQKTYEVFPKNDRRQGFQAHVAEQVENLSPGPLTIKTTISGPVAPPREMSEMDDRQILAGYPVDNSIDAGHWMLNEFVKTPERDITVNDKGQPMRWIGASSVYFLAIVRPEPAPKGQKWVSLPVARAEAQALNPDAPSEEDRKVGLTLTTGDVTLKPGAAAELPLSVFFGPKKRSVIASDYYSAPPLGYDCTFRTMSHGFCGFCAFQPLINLLVDMLRGFHFILRDWGLAIIALVGLVRLCLHPITRRSTISMQKMQKMGPEMEKLKQKYKDNQEELNKAMVQFYKEQGVAPILGCLPMFLQTPIWIALWEALQNTFELRLAPFLHAFGHDLTWIHDLAKPDAIYTFAHPIPLLFGWHLHSINILPILMGVMMYLQQKYTPRPAAMTPEQNQQQKMMIIMSTALFPLMLYNGPSGLNLYILTSSAVGIWEYKVIRDHIRRREEAEKAGKVIVETNPKMRRRGGGFPQETASPPRGLAGWFAKMQAMAEEARKDQEKRKKK